MKLINLSTPLIWLLIGLLTAACGAYAQETGQKVRQRSEPLPRDQTGIVFYEKLLRDADALIRSGKPASAYALLVPLEFEHAGEARFDHLIGIAALDSGNPAMATLAFERVLAVNPDFPGVRFDMGRAYFQLGDMPRAKAEFVMALKQNPTRTAHANIENYLDKIAARETGKRTFITGYVEAMVGHDSNVNNSTSQSQILVDVIPAPTNIITLDPTNVKTSDSYYGLATGGDATYMQNAYWGLYAGADLKQRGNIKQKSFNTLDLNARTGMIFGAKTNRLSIEMLGGRYTLGGSKNYDSTGLKADWRRMFSPDKQLYVFAQYMKYRFADPVMQPNDFDQQVIGLGWQQILAGGKSATSSSVYFGAEKDVSKIITVASPDGGRNDGAKRFWGLRASGQTAISEETTLFANAGIQVGDYDKINYYFLRQRNDRFYDLKMGAVLRWEKLWALRPQFSFFRNDSNITIYSYDRMDVSLTIRRDFR